MSASPTDPQRAQRQADTIAGERVILRPKRPEDAPNDYAWRCDPELSRFDAVAPLTAPYESFLADYLSELQHPSAYRRRFGVDTLDGRHIGNCSFYNIDYRRGEAELGIMVGDKAYWNSGYGTDIVRTLLRYIFERTPLNRVYLYVLDWNHRAQRCFLKSGFIERQRTREMGHNFVIMDITRARFEAIRGGEPA